MLESMVSVKAIRSRNKRFESKGKLVVVEGIDGSGKYTQIRPTYFSGDFS